MHRLLLPDFEEDTRSTLCSGGRGEAHGKSAPGAVGDERSAEDRKSETSQVVSLTRGFNVKKMRADGEVPSVAVEACFGALCGKRAPKKWTAAQNSAKSSYVIDSKGFSGLRFFR